MASAECNSLSSLTEVPKRQTSIMQELRSSEESNQFSSLAQLANERSKMLEPKSSEQSNQFSSLAQLANRHSKIMEPKSSEESSQLSSLAELANRHSKILKPKSSEESSQFSSLAHLANRHSKILKPKSSQEGIQFSSLVQLANKHSLEANNQSSEGHSFSSLAQLANRHVKVTKLHASDEDDNFSSLLKLANMHSGSEVQTDGQLLPQAEITSQHRVHRKDSISILTSSLSQHLKVDENKVTSSGRHVTETKRAQRTGQISYSQNGYVDLKTCFAFLPKNETEVPAEQEPVSPVVQRSRHLATCCSQASDTGSKSKRTGLFLVSEKTDELARDCGTISDSSSCIRVEPTPVVRTLSKEENEMDWKIDLTNPLISPGFKTSQISASSKPEVTDWKLQDVEQEVSAGTAVLGTSELMLDFDIGSTILNQKLPSRKRKSPFGRTLCKKWKQLCTPYIRPQKQSLGKIVRFTFNTVSPDDKILRHLQGN
jgi:hypothetical protein